MRGNNSSRRRIRFPNLFRIRFCFVAFFRRRHPKQEASSDFRRRHPKQEASSDCDASAFFEGCMKYDEVQTVALGVLNQSFLSSDSCPAPVSVTSFDSGSDESDEEKCRDACCVDDYMMLDDHSLDQLSTFLVVRP
jgi:hypothetical protein